jgi:hypothetical protein
MEIIHRITGIFSKFGLNYILKERKLSSLINNYNVITMKHCFPASDMLEDIEQPDPSSQRKSIENYQAVYRLLRDKFDQYPRNLFIIWTIPPRHRLFQPSEGTADRNAARATEFSNWLRTGFLVEGGGHSNICIWDIRSILMDKNSNYLKYDFEFKHDSPDSHPNTVANNTAGPQFAEFTVKAMSRFFGNESSATALKIVFLHHSTGFNIFSYPALGIPVWLKKYNLATRTNHVISHLWYPVAGNMPVHYYNSWVNL